MKPLAPAGRVLLHSMDEGNTASLGGVEVRSCDDDFLLFHLVYGWKG